MMTATPTETIPPITRVEAQTLAATEYARLVELLRALSTDDWAKPTDCPLWDVRAVAGHCVGMMCDFTSFRSLTRRMLVATKAAKRAGGPMIDSMTALQVADNAQLSTADLIARAEENGPKAARWRTKVPAPFRRMPMKQEVGDKRETWRMGYLLDTILTRDPWMHRVDIAGATGRDLVLTPEHDGRIVADVVAEWSRRHAAPCTLALTGPAGGDFVVGDGSGEGMAMDAVEFCRTVSGRSEARGLLATEVPF
jgi:uncharacterized protein (TIGR03083 family)